MCSIIARHLCLGTAGRARGEDSGGSAQHSLHGGSAACTPQLLDWQEVASAVLMLDAVGLWRVPVGVLLGLDLGRSPLIFGCLVCICVYFAWLDPGPLAMPFPHDFPDLVGSARICAGSLEECNMGRYPVADGHTMSNAPDLF